MVFNAEISAAIQEGLSDALIALGRPFTAETVFSHPSKLELIDNAHAAGYTVVLHVLLIPEELAVHGVAYRGASRWNPVAENKSASATTASGHWSPTPSPDLTKRPSTTTAASRVRASWRR